MKKEKLVSKILDFLTVTELDCEDKDQEFFAELRQVVINYTEGIRVTDTCKTCGCSEFLCGHNRRK